MDELTAWLTLNRAPALERSSFHALRQHFAGVSDIVAASARALRAAGASKGLVDWLASPPRESIDADRRWLDCESHHFICLESPDYPPLLGRLDDAPLGLFVRGSPSWLAMPQLAMVGARHPTPPGAETAYDFAAHLARCGLTVTSGLAIGIDAASHRGALSGGATIAVCGTGLDVNYPRSHAALAAQITQCGALVSEFGTGTLPMKGNFPRRNRVIAGLSLGTLVVEAAVRSGSLITARLAAEQGREVFAIPGSIHNPMSRGCHRLIRQGAKLVETADDIFEELRPLSDSLQCLAQTPVTPERSQLPGIPARSEASGPRLDKGYEILLDALGFEPAGVDLLVVRTGLRADEVASMLLILELDGHILPYPGGLYVRAHPRQ
ncbi:MAG TPA: DNA-processing protein DprA [Povalibacter sp.]|nr:DNA-processing protein DprA [Povalibacter sp.]